MRRLNSLAGALTCNLNGVNSILKGLIAAS